MKANSPACVVGILILAAGVATSSLASAAGQPLNDQLPEMVATIFAKVPQSDNMSVVYKDDPKQVYLAFYLATYGDTQELRAYKVTFSNVSRYEDEPGTIDIAVAMGNHAEAFDGLITLMRLELGAQYVSDVGLDGVREEEVAVGSGHMRDRFHKELFASYEEANAAYMEWLERALALARASD